MYQCVYMYQIYTFLSQIVLMPTDKNYKTLYLTVQNLKSLHIKTTLNNTT
jgi:predicted PilT family ATPase